MLSVTYLWLLSRGVDGVFASLGLAVWVLTKGEHGKQKKAYSFKAEGVHFVELFVRSTW